MDWQSLGIGLGIGLIVGVISGYFWLVGYLIKSLYGRMMTDRHDPDHYIFRLEFTKDPAEMPMKQKYIVLKIEETKLNSIKTEVD